MFSGVLLPVALYVLYRIYEIFPKIFLDRIQENGIVKNENSTGPAARAARFKFDARKDSKSLDYRNFTPVTESGADSFSRLL